VLVNQMVRRLLGLMGVVGGVTGALYGIRPLQSFFQFHLSRLQQVGVIIGGGVLGGLIMYLLAPLMITAVLQFTDWVERRLQTTSIQDLLAAIGGLLVGLLIANLLSAPLAKIPAVGGILPTLGVFVLGYVGVMVGLKKRDDLGGLFGFWGRRGREKTRDLATSSKEGSVKILDTSVIIDGRIADVCKAGFFEGTAVIPSFVLEELRHIADSSDMVKRKRGRRGLEVLNILRQQLGDAVVIYEHDEDQGQEVDSRLVRLAKKLNAKIMTNDYNLNQVAELQGVPVLNINELANSLKRIILPGEHISVYIIREGKEPGQGVGYLDDGTMIVVDGGKHFVGETVEVTVTNILQTSAGRMIFAKPRTS